MSISSTIKQSGSIEGRRPKSPRAISKTDNLQDRNDPVKNAAEAVRETILLLADRQWHPKKYIRKIAVDYHLDINTLLDYCLAAESNRWCCLPAENTPTTAPDE